MGTQALFGCKEGFYAFNPTFTPSARNQIPKRIRKLPQQKTNLRYTLRGKISLPLEIAADTNAYHIRSARM
jgi:hypothetical protein